MNRRDFLGGGLLAAASFGIGSVSGKEVNNSFTETYFEIDGVPCTKYFVKVNGNNPSLLSRANNFISESGNEISLPDLELNSFQSNPEELLEHIIEWKKLNLENQNEKIHGVISYYEENPKVFHIGVYTEKLQPNLK